MTTNAFVLGNGTSRLQIKDLNELKSKGPVFGCNALYREFTPDYLIAVDTKMIKEITLNDWHLQNEVWTNPNTLTKTISHLNIFNPNKGWSSGPTALWFASTKAYKTIYILGFDYVGLGKDNQEVNNVYADTPNYKTKRDKATYYGNWTRQTMMTANSFPKIRYIRVVPEGDYFVPDHLKDLQNFTHITYKEFKEKFKLL